MMRDSGWVYVVDDDVSMREALSSLARSRGWRAKTFESARAFLAHPRPRVPSCLVLDVNMPGLTGPELQRQLEKTRDEIPIIYVTGNADIPTAVRAMKAGAVEFLTKPFDDEALIGAIHQSLSRWPLPRSRTDPASGSGLLEFAPFRLDINEQCLWRCVGPEPERIVLTPKAFTLLRYLVEHAGRLVTEEQLLQAAWPNVYVQHEAVKCQLYEIRKILGDTPKAPRFIETLHRRGYRFIAPVRNAAAVPEAATCGEPPLQDAAARSDPASRAHDLGPVSERAGQVTVNIPERVAQAIEALWNEALANARQSLERQDLAGAAGTTPEEGGAGG